MKTSAPVMQAASISRSRQFHWGAWITGLLISFGFTAIWGLLIIWSTLLLPQPQRPDGVKYEFLRFGVDGQPVFIQSFQNNTAHVVDLDRQFITKSQDRFSRNPISLPGKQRKSNADWSGMKINAIGRVSEPPAFWYFVESCDRTGYGYFESIHPDSRLTLGYIGMNGAQTKRPAITDQFDLRNGQLTGGRYGNYYSIYEVNAYETDGPTPIPFISSNGNAFRIDFVEQAVIPIDGVNDVITAARISKSFLRESGGRNYVDTEETDSVALRTPDKVVVRDLTTGEMREWLLPTPELQKADSFLFLENDELLAVHHNSVVTNQFDPFKTRLNYHFDWISPDGVVQKSETVAALEMPSSERQTMILMNLTGVPLLTYGFELIAMPMQLIGLGKARNWWAAMQTLLPLRWSYLILPFLTSGVAIFLAHRKARQHGVPLHPAWYLLLAVMGIPGYLGYRWHRSWPEKEIPALPQTNGTEILFPAPQPT